MKIAGGTNLEGNGLELWRKLYAEYAGNDKLLQVAGRTRLQDFPACRNMRQMNHHIDDWLHLFYEYGDGVGPEHAKTMFMRTLPDTLRTEVYRRPEVERMDLIELIEWVRNQTVYGRSEDSCTALKA